MRTLITLLALAMVGAAAPVAPHGFQHLSGTLAVFATAVVSVLGTCLVAGWLRSEARVSHGAVAALYSRFAPGTAADDRLVAERFAQAGAVHQTPGLTGMRHVVQLGEPGESVMLRARTTRHGHSVGRREPIGLQDEISAEGTMQRR